MGFNRGQRRSARRRKLPEGEHEWHRPETALALCGLLTGGAVTGAARWSRRLAAGQWRPRTKTSASDLRGDIYTVINAAEPDRRWTWPSLKAISPSARSMSS